MPESVSERHRAWERGWCSRSEEAAEGYAPLFGTRSTYTAR